MLNVDDVEDAVGELQRAAARGLAGAMIPIRPGEQRYDHPMYEPLWAAAQDLEIPLSLHVGTRRWRPGVDLNAPSMPTDVVDTSNREFDMREAVAAMIFGGVFERYPKLHVGAVEFEVAWAPYFMGRIVFNKRWFEAQSQANQAILVQAMQEAGRWQRTAMRDRDADATQRIKAAGVQVYELSAQAREQLRQLALTVHERFADRVGKDYLQRVSAEVARASR